MKIELKNDFQINNKQSQFNWMKKFQMGGPMSLSSYLDLSGGKGKKAIDEGTKKVATAFNTAMGWLGEMLTGPLSGMAVPAGTATGAWGYSQSPQYAKNATTLQPAAKKLIDENAVYLSPSSHVAAWTQGSLDPKKGAEVLASDPRLQSLGIIGDLATLKYGPKIIKGTPKAVKATTNAAINTVAKAGSKTAKAAVVAREINNAIKNTTPRVSQPVNTAISFISTTPQKFRTSLAFFERKPSKISLAERAGIPKGERFVRPFRVAAYPGYQLKSLMKGSPLERQLSKTGTISVNNLIAQVNKASEVEKAVINKVLEEKFNGQKTIDYNQLKKAVQDELITYERKPDTQYADYGIKSLGFETQMDLDSQAIAYNPVTGNFEQVAPFQQFIPDYTLNTFTFESPRIPVGSNKHYGPATLGHSRTYTTKTEPNILHVMESQSDWGQAKNSLETVETFNNLQKRIADLEAKPQKTIYDKIDLESLKKLKEDLLNQNSSLIVDPQQLHLRNNYLQRQLQENLRYAAENRQTKMRYPTSETAAKIEGYQKVNHTQLNELSKQQMKLGEQFENGEISWEEYDKMIDAINKQKKELFGKEYDPKHQTILKKYADFPKLFQKLYKGQNIRTVTDAKGNSWYEVDVPKGYLSREWQFKQGGILNFLK